MKPPIFRYHDPRTIDETVALLAEYGDEGKVLAGGQSLMPLLNLRLAAPVDLIDLNRVAEMTYIRSSLGDAELRLGAMTRHSHAEFSGEIGRRLPLLSKAVRLIGHTAIRNRGTLGGSLAHADPSAELPATMTALDATIVARSASSSREIAIDEMFEMPLVTSLRPDELLVEIRVGPQPSHEGSAILEVARRHGDFALVGVIARVMLASDGSLESVRLVSFGTGPVPVRLERTAQALVGQHLSASILDEAAGVASAEVRPTGDGHGSEPYRRSVTGVLVRRAVTQAVEDAIRRTDQEGNTP